MFIKLIFLAILCKLLLKMNFLVKQNFQGIYANCIKRSEVIKRAKCWADKHVPYNQVNP